MMYEAGGWKGEGTAQSLPLPVPDLFLLPGGKRRRGCDYQLHRGVGRGPASRRLPAARPGPDHPGEETLWSKESLHCLLPPFQSWRRRRVHVDGVTADFEEGTY